MQSRTNVTVRTYLIGAIVSLILIWVIIKISPILSPFIASAIIAYMLNPLVDKLREKGVSRVVAGLLVTTLALTVVSGVLMVLIPMLINQFQNMFAKIPELMKFIQMQAIPWINDKFHMRITLKEATITNYFSGNTDRIREFLQKMMPTVAKSGTTLIFWVTNILLMPILLYYMLVDWTRWRVGLKTLIPRRFLEPVNSITGEMDHVLGEFLRGQLLVMAIMGTFYGAGLALVGLENGFAIGMMAGFLVFIPYLGVFTGMVLATCAALLSGNGWSSLAMVWGVFGVGQVIESYIVTPRFVGERIGLSPLGVIFALMAFGELMGFVGMMLALPLAAITLVLMRRLVNHYLESTAYLRTTEEVNSAEVEMLE